MSDIAAPPHVPEAIHPPAISLREIWPWALFGFALLLLIYFVGADEGAASLVPGRSCTSGCTTGVTCSASPATSRGPTCSARC